MQGCRNLRKADPETAYAQKRSGISIAPSKTESAAGRDDAKRPPPSTIKRYCRGHGERFPRKDPGLFDLLGSSLSCDATDIALLNEHLCLWFAELLKHPQQHPTQVHSEHESASQRVTFQDSPNTEIFLQHTLCPPTLFRELLVSHGTIQDHQALKKSFTAVGLRRSKTFQDLLRTERVFADLRSSWDFLELLWTSF